MTAKIAMLAISKVGVELSKAILCCFCYSHISGLCYFLNTKLLYKFY